MRLFLVRHGESENNVKGLYTGLFDAPLVEKGRLQAVSIRPFLSSFKFDKVYSSDLSRAYETSRLALPDYNAEKTALIREIDCGSLTNAPVKDDVLSKFGKDVYRQIKSQDYSFFGGESFETVCQRKKKFTDSLLDSEYENVIAFTHGGIQRAMLFDTIGKHNGGNIRLSNCAIIIFEYINSKWVLKDLINTDIITELSGTVAD